MEEEEYSYLWLELKAEVDVLETDLTLAMEDRSETRLSDLPLMPVFKSFFCSGMLTQSR